MTSSTSRNSTSALRYRARRNPPLNPLLQLKRRALRHKQPAQYIGGLSSRERVDMVLHDLFQQHRWTLKDLIRHMVTAESDQKNAHSCSTRARALANAIWKQEEVAEMLARVSQDNRPLENSALVDRIRAELQNASAAGLGEFKIDATITSLDIAGLAARVQEAAPELWQLLGAIMEPQDGRSRRNTFVKFEGSILMICSILAHGRAPIKASNFPTLLGLHLHSMGVKRRTINVLAGLGITPSYKTINTRRGQLAEIGNVLNLLQPLLPPSHSHPRFHPPHSTPFLPPSRDSYPDQPDSSRPRRLILV
jgi:hypothetical protein